ncbi:MAG: hypothetical protein OEO79_11285 [Gemmatimonadota bacterium]|nr:hypothetical protein [Gemmatimonadota bacterium]
MTSHRVVEEAMLRRVSAGVLFALLSFGGDAQAQTAQTWSIQLSALGVRLTGERDDRLAVGGGGELQLRWNPSSFSLGVGAQTTVHELDNATVTYKGGFVEPRYILTSFGNSVALYGSARLMTLSATVEILGFQREIDGWALSGGGGLLIRLGGRVNGDLGLTAGKEFYNGNSSDGATIVTRIGLAVGLG